MLTECDLMLGPVLGTVLPSRSSQPGSRDADDSGKCYHQRYWEPGKKENNSMQERGFHEDGTFELGLQTQECSR